MSFHECVFDEVLIDQDDGPLRAGMKVIIPCRECEETPLEHLEWLADQSRKADAALLAARPVMPLFHWSPRGRRKQIIRYGLRPLMRVTTSTADDDGLGVVAGVAAFPVVCFADAPSWAWALSGGMSWTPAGEWDLWQTDVSRLTDPVVLPSEDRMSGIHEVRTGTRVYKRDLWWVGSRVKLTRDQHPDRMVDRVG